MKHSVKVYRSGNDVYIDPEYADAIMCSDGAKAHGFPFEFEGILHFSTAPFKGSTKVTLNEDGLIRPPFMAKVTFKSYTFEGVFYVMRDVLQDQLNLDPTHKCHFYISLEVTK